MFVVSLYELLLWMYSCPEPSQLPARRAGPGAWQILIDMFPSFVCLKHPGAVLEAEDTLR